MGAKELGRAEPNVKMPRTDWLTRINRVSHITCPIFSWQLNMLYKIIRKGPVMDIRGRRLVKVTDVS